MNELDDDWQRERSMSPRAFERAIGALGVSQSASGRFLGVSESTLRRYLKGDANIPVSVVLLLRLMLALNIRPIAPRRKRHVRQPIQPTPDLT